MNPRKTQSDNIIRAAQRIANEVVAPLAHVWDTEARFPHELFTAMEAEKLNAMSVPTAQGGLGIGPDTHGDDEQDPLTAWLVSKAIARADSSSGHNQQNHTNVVHTTAYLGSDEHRDTAVRAVAEEGAVFGGWGSELNGQPPEQFTTARRVNGGFKLYGTKLFSTNAGTARFATIFAYPENVKDPVEQVLVFVADTSQPGLAIEPTWWANATGMRSTVSHKVVLDGFFVRDRDLLGEPGDYWRKMTQIRYLPQFAANFQGVGEHVVDYGISYLRDRGRINSEWNQRCIAEAKIALHTADLLLRDTAESMRTGDEATARKTLILRAFSEAAVGDAIGKVQATCGASIYMAPHPLERVLRDWQFYSRHESLNLILTGLGRGILNETVNASSPASVGVSFHGEGHVSTTGAAPAASR